MKFYFLIQKNVIKFQNKLKIFNGIFDYFLSSFNPLPKFFHK
jgi:hypothetical protein